MARYAYIDNSNLWIEGQRVSAVKRCLPGAETMLSAKQNNVKDPTFRIDYGKLYMKLIAQDVEPGGFAKLWGSRPPPESFWNMLETNGFKTYVYDRSIHGNEKQVDTGMTTEIMDDSYAGFINKGKDMVVIVSGDQDFVPVIQSLRKRDHFVQVIGWGHATSHLLKQSANVFSNLESFFDDICT